ncbi:MAG: hypothetical protein ACI8TL_000265 [Natronomonas sp.]|jgi:hypothetical protein
MDEITLRLSTATTAALQSEADERGVTVQAHLRDIVDAYQADDRKRVGRTVEYVHTVGRGKTAVEHGSADRTEEIGSFQYGSRSVLTEADCE